MKFNSLLFFTLGFPITILAQKEQIEPVSDSISENPKAVKTSFWTGKGQVSLLANQTAFNADWQGGGTSNLAVNSKLKYTLNYKKGAWSWDNLIRLAYGITKLDDESKLRKTDDAIELGSTVSKNTGGGLWSYSGYFNFKSQFADGYNYKKDGSKTLTSKGFSPAYIQLGPGLLWKKSDLFNINIAPATTRLILVDSFFTEKKAAFGVEKGETQEIEFGASIAGIYKFKFVKNVTIENQLNLYSNYLENTSNIDLNYTFNMVSQINKHMSANLTFQTIYDDDTTSAFQVRELIAIGVNYDL